MKTKLNNDILRLVISTRKSPICAISSRLLIAICKGVIMGRRKEKEGVHVREKLIFDVETRVRILQ